MKWSPKPSCFACFLCLFILLVYFTLSTSFYLAITGFTSLPLEDILLAIASGPHGEFHSHLHRLSLLASGSAIHCLICFLFPVFRCFFPSFKTNRMRSVLSSQIHHIHCFVTIFLALVFSFQFYIFLFCLFLLLLLLFLRVFVGCWGGCSLLVCWFCLFVFFFFFSCYLISATLCHCITSKRYQNTAHWYLLLASLDQLNV